MMIGAIFWAMVDIWPTPDFTWSFDVFRLPLWEFLQSLGIAFALGIVVSIILPRTPIWKSLVLSATIKGSETGEGTTKEIMAALVGREGRTSSELFPGGKVEIEGVRYDAISSLGQIPKGTKVEVVDFSGFELIVKEVDL